MNNGEIYFYFIIFASIGVLIFAIWRVIHDANVARRRRNQAYEELILGMTSPAGQKRADDGEEEFHPDAD